MAQILSAYEVVMSPQSSHAARAQASAFLEQVKQQPALCREGALQLLARAEPQTRHLAAILLENVVKLHWTVLNVAQRQQVRADVMQILADVRDNEAGYVREKISSLVNEVAKKDWPQEWPEYFDALVNISQVGGDGQRQMVLLVIRRLVEDVTHFSSDLGKRRCDQLLAELKSKSKPMMLFITGGIKTQHLQWAQTKSPVAGKLALALIHTLHVFLPWVKGNVLFDCNVPELLMSFLHDVHELRMPAAESLLILMERDHGKISMEGKFLFPLEHCVVFVRALNSQHGTAQERALFHELLGKILVAVGKRHLNLVEKHAYAVPPNYAEFLALMVRFLEHPDLVFCETTVPFFKQLLSVDAFRLSPAFDAMAPTLATTFVRKLVWGVTPQAVQAVLVHFSSDDDDDDDETPGGASGKARVAGFLTRFSNLLKDVLRKLASLRPELVLTIALTETTDVTNKLRQVGLSAITSRKSVEYQSLMGCVDVCDSLMKGGIPYADVMQSTNVALKEKLTEGMRTLLLLFFNFDTVNPLLMSLKIRSFRLFSSYYRLHPKHLTAVLERLLSMVLFRAPDETGRAHGELSKGTLKVRKEACDSFLRLCVEMPDVLVEQLGAIATHVGKNLIEGATSFTEKAVLRDGLVAISTAQKDVGQRQAFLKQIIGPVLVVWTGASMAETVNSCRKLLAWVGAAPNLEPKWENGRALVSVLDTFRFTIKRGGAAAGEVLRAALPNVFALCRTLHRLWKPGHPANDFLRAKMPRVFSPDQSLYAALTGRKLEKNFELFVAAWLDDTRNSTYKLIGVCCKFPGFFTLPDLSNLLSTFVFAELEVVAVQHMSLLVEYVVENLLKYAPQDAYVSFLGSLLPRMMGFFLSRLHASWAQENSIRKGSSAASDEDEVVQTKLAADFSRSWLRVLMTLLHVEKNPNLKGTDQYAQFTPMCTFMINTPDILMGLLATLCGVLTETCDSVTQSHAMEIIERLLGKWLSNPALHRVLGNQLLHALLKAVNKRANSDNAMRYLRVAAEIYAKLRGVSPDCLNVLKHTGVSAQSIAAFEARLRTDPDGASKKSPKNRALALKEALGDFVGDDVKSLGSGMSPMAQEFLARMR